MIEVMNHIKVVFGKGQLLRFAGTWRLVYFLSQDDERVTTMIKIPPGEVMFGVILLKISTGNVTSMA